MKCRLCGYSFSKQGTKCARCPLNRGCKVICCPNCGYSYAEDSNIVNIVRGLLKRG